MKTFTNLMESCVTSDVNQGNSYQNTLGVTNHLTPINNIVTNVKNLFSGLPIVVSVAEDGCSIKINSSEFTSKANVEKVLLNPYYNNRLSVLTYIMQQGLSFVKLVNLGQFMVVYICPSDMMQAKPTIDGTGIEPEEASCPCQEQLSEEVELDTILESDDDKELKDITKEKLSEIMSSKDKVKAAKQMELLVSQSMELPREYYFAGVKDKDGDESIALRWKYTKKRRKNRTAEATRSLVNIYDETKDGVWVQDFVKDSMFKVPDEVEKLIKNLLELIGAKETSDPAVYSLESKDDDKKDDDKKDDDKSSSSSKESSNDDDSEDDSSRGDNSDNLLDEMR